MARFLKSYEVRWNDIDANVHLANSAYLEYFSSTRMAFLDEIGFSMQAMRKYGIGPVVFRESIIYFKEVFYGKPVQVSLEVKGLSEQGMFFEFEHNLYDHKGKNCARSPIIGGWIDLKERRLTNLPPELLKGIPEKYKSKDFKILTRSDTRGLGEQPIDIEL